MTDWGVVDILQNVFSIVNDLLESDCLLLCLIWRAFLQLRSLRTGDQLVAFETLTKLC